LPVPNLGSVAGCVKGSVREQNAFAEQVEAGAAEHLA
jgi:hypothetical protein